MLICRNSIQIATSPMYQSKSFFAFSQNLSSQQCGACACHSSCHLLCLKLFWFLGAAAAALVLVAGNSSAASCLPGLLRSAGSRVPASSSSIGFDFA